MVILLIATLFGVVVATNACENVSLSLMQGQTASSSESLPEVCASPPVETALRSKVLFLVDESGSNAGNPPPGTDPQKTFRSTVIQNFVTKYRSNPQVFYSFVVFNGSSARAFINNGADTQPIFSNDATQMDAALVRFKSETDQDRTPYRAALAMATAAISNDRATDTSGLVSTYYVVLLSDGQPTDYGASPDLVAIDTDIKSLILTAGRATLSTIYYNLANVAADAAVLQNMALTGNGGFSNLNIDGIVPIDQLIQFKSADPWVIKKFLVSNLNAAPCDDGSMDVDSDADGICDKDEIRYNTQLAHQPIVAAKMNGKVFDAQNRNSFNASYHDLIFYRHLVYGEALDSNCRITGDLTVDDVDQDLLNVCEEAYLTSNTPVGPTVAWSTAMLKSADPKNFDSDGDGYLDSIELTYGRSRSNALDYNSPQRTIDGMTMDQIITQHLNPISPSSGTPYNGKLEFSRVNEQGQNCYTYNQNVLPLYHTLPVTKAQVSGYSQLAHGTDENVILIYFIQTKEGDVNGPGELRYYYQSLKYGDVSTPLNLNLTRYSSYSADQALASPSRK